MNEPTEFLELKMAFRELVAEMRQAQRLFFVQRTANNLRAAKRLEARVDRALQMEPDMFDRREV